MLAKTRISKTVVQWRDWIEKRALRETRNWIDRIEVRLKKYDHRLAIAEVKSRNRTLRARGVHSRKHASHRSLNGLASSASVNAEMVQAISRLDAESPQPEGDEFGGRKKSRTRRVSR